MKLFQTLSPMCQQVEPTLGPGYHITCKSEVRLRSKFEHIVIILFHYTGCSKKIDFGFGGRKLAWHGMAKKCPSYDFFFKFIDPLTIVRKPFEINGPC